MQMASLKQRFDKFCQSCADHKQILMFVDIFQLLFCASLVSYSNRKHSITYKDYLLQLFQTFPVSYINQKQNSISTLLFHLLFHIYLGSHYIKV